MKSVPAAVRHVWQRALCVVTALVTEFPVSDGDNFRGSAGFLLWLCRQECARCRRNDLLLLKPFFIGRSALDREKAWHQFRTADRWWHHLPFWAYGSFDSLCWILSALAANQPLYRYLGGYRDTVPVYLSSLVHDSPQQFAGEALTNHNQFFITSCVQRLRTFGKTLRHMPW